jgi:flavin reductase (DIM6/NTAB) family NADH-FMN oxidoreductase RutF
MNLCSAALPRGQNEFEFAGLDAEPSLKVTPPRVAGIPAALECTWLRTVPMVASSGEARYFLVLGEVVAMYVDDRYVREGRVDTAAMEIVMRGGYRDYFSAREEARFQMTRPHAPCR